MRSTASSLSGRTRIMACLAAAVTVLISASFAGSARAQTEPLTGTSVDIAVLRVDPSTPAQSETPKPLVIQLLLTNTTDQSLKNVRIDVQRGNPIGDQRALDQAIAHPQPPDPDLAASVVPVGKQPPTVDLGPRSQAQLSFTTDTEIPNEAGLCLCANLIYPLYITAHFLDQTGQDVQVGTTQTYVPSFKDQDHATVQVSWVWPILDRPHRLVGDSQFLDDALSSSVAGGRLDRVLQVAELADLSPTPVPMTLVIDPELVDELAVMAAGSYRVGEPGKPSTAGVGTSAAKAWLTRLNTLLSKPGMRFAFTPFADPDVESLTRNGLGWTASLGRAAQTRVDTVLGGRQPTDDVAWPADEAVSDDTLAAIVRQGATGVILNDKALPAQRSDVDPTALAALQTTAGSVTAYITTSSIERYVGPVLSVGGAGLAQLPELVSEVAVHALQPSGVNTYVVITPPRFIDPSPEVAARAISDTAHAFWSAPSSLAAASDNVKPSNRAQLVPPKQPTGLSPQTISAATTLTRIVPALTTMLSSTDAAALLGSLPAAVQRAESTGWRTDVNAGNQFARLLTQQIDGLQSGVRIIKPSSGTYTLASDNSPLPLTIENTLNVAVRVRVRVTTVNGLPGFRADDTGLQVIAPGNKITLHIPTHTQRTGRFEVQAVLVTPNSQEIGVPVVLTVRSTALGLIGVVITVIAVVVLAFALLVRFLRLWRGRSSRTGGPAPVVTE